ncbi:hypothetical protein B0T16DRAFT_454913 [Cercophora newfieldiana]|uniref:Uncharacterized protein n=1 Tax=Cercophora newfieldiana TaxID=92897 RepID=A0AA39YHT4_9PEZI|nr:hypothetical protein B0T16DRAFT_454913 [Cercophora newfieldiana]
MAQAVSPSAAAEISKLQHDVAELQRQNANLRDEYQALKERFESYKGDSESDWSGDTAIAPVPWVPVPVDTGDSSETWLTCNDADKAGTAKPTGIWPACFAAARSSIIRRFFLRSKAAEIPTGSSNSRRDDSELDENRTADHQDNEQHSDEQPEWDEEQYRDKPRHDEQEADKHQRLQLAVQTRLDDDDWIANATAASHVRICPEKGQRLLLRATQLGREALWHAIMKRWPSIAKTLEFEGGPSLIRCAGKEMGNILAEFDRRESYSSDIEMYQAMREFPALRNAAAHPWPRYTNKDYDDLVYRAHRLAVALGDKRCAYKIRAIRDSLEREAQATADTLRRRDQWACLPFSYIRAEHHHEILFRRMHDWPQEVGPSMPDYIVRAKERWVVFELEEGF